LEKVGTIITTITNPVVAKAFIGGK
jgi:hypothetical protein